MPDTPAKMSELFLTELTAELAKSRKSLERAGDEHASFKPHEKSMPLLTLCNHLTTVSGIIGTILTVKSLDMGSPSDPRRIVKETSIAAVLKAFDELAASTLAALGAADDAAFFAPWQATRAGNVVFSGTMYGAFRNMGVNHMIHHRAQLGVYLRLLDIPVPALFGPTADEK